MIDTVRLYGPEVGVSTAVVDANISGVTTDGNIVFAPHSKDYDKFTLTTDNFTELLSNGLAYDMSQIDSDDPIWNAIESVETSFHNDTDNTDPYFDAARTLFAGGP